MRFDVLAASPIPGAKPITVSSHALPAEAAEAAKREAVARATVVEVWDHDLQKTIFRARGSEWRWITR